MREESTTFVQPKVLHTCKECYLNVFLSVYKYICTSLSRTLSRARQVGNLPEGEVFTAPATVDGVLVCDVDVIPARCTIEVDGCIIMRDGEFTL